MKIADVAGWVLLGFLHIEDVTKELQQALGLPQPAAAQIAASLMPNYSVRSKRS